MTDRIVNEIALKNNIGIIDYPFEKIKACSIENGNRYFIGINEKNFNNEAEKNTAKAHELGHCMTGALYCESSPLFTQEKCEYRANRWAIRKLIPKKTLIEYLKKGYQMWDIAEELEVTEEFLWMAYHHYFD
ncbi:MAG: ImmA/IrrE family metallo-endopeptidase [Eubacterium sp.]|nr:ImmA/IrrE family metallo-endopeptidase [Eubacterium sp.]